VHFQQMWHLLVVEEMEGGGVDEARILIIHVPCTTTNAPPNYEVVPTGTASA